MQTASSGAEASGTANNVAAPKPEETDALAKAESPAPLSAEDLQVAFSMSALQRLASLDTAFTLGLSATCESIRGLLCTRRS